MSMTRCWKDVSDTLGTDDLYDVKKELNTVSADWYNIGLALRLPTNTLDGIKKSNADPSTYLNSMLIEWLKQNYNVEMFGEPTWQRLVDAVGDPAGGGNMRLAKDIAMRHITKAISANYTEADISTLAQKCWYHGHISRELAEERLTAEDTDCFLVRMSRSQEGKFALSVYYSGAINHFIIHKKNEYLEVEGSQEPFKSLPELVEYYENNSLSAHGVMLVVPCLCPMLKPHLPLMSNQDPLTAAKDDEPTSAVSKSHSCPSTSFLSPCTPELPIQEPTAMESDDKEDSKNISTQESHPEEPCNQHVRYSGYMEKLPTSKSKSTVMKGWKRRFFKVMEGCIFYYEDETSKKYKGYVGLSKSDIKCDEEKCQIQVTEEKGKCLVMKAPKIDELKKCYCALKLEAAKPT